MNKRCDKGDETVKAQALEALDTGIVSGYNAGISKMIAKDYIEANF